MHHPYTPTPTTLKNYAKVLVDFALGGGKGIKKGDTVRLTGSEASRPLYLETMKAIWDAGGNVIASYAPDSYTPQDSTSRYFYQHATPDQLNFFAEQYYKGLTDQIDHQINILSETNYQELSDVDPAKIMRRSKTTKPLHDWLDNKESAGKFTWTIGLYGTEVMAKEAGLTIEQYWQQIIDACYLDQPDPIAKWQSIQSQAKATVKQLNQLKIEQLRVTGPDLDLQLKLGVDRQWVGCDGRNIPSSEIFISPDWRGTTGWARFNQPLYRYGSIIKGIQLHFENGKVTKATATENQNLLTEMIATEGADKVGEFSLTDTRFSQITHFMAETLYDENIGGPHGNTHIALGASYHDTYAGDPSSITEQQWASMGFNDSSIHTDIVSTTERTVTATLHDGTEKVIYKDGKFTI